MKIVIVGAGLGGLSAAVCFARKGHEVQVLEQRQTLSPRGGGINIRPGASRIMHKWGLRPDLEKIGQPTPTFLQRNVRNGEVSLRVVTLDASDEIDWGTSRELVMKLLYQRALQVGAKVHFDCSVENTAEDATGARLTLKDGRVVSADLVLAADGIRSRIRSQILSDVKDPIDPLISDVTMYGMNVDANKLKARPDTRRLLDPDYALVWEGKDCFVVSRYFYKTNSVWGLFGIKSENDMKGLWDENGDIKFVRDFFDDSCEDIRAFLEEATSCDRWKLAELPNLPRWKSKGGRIVLLGDSAHAMEPNAAQGFSMIVEDIGVLDYLIERDSNASANVSAIADIWQMLRKPRAERIKDYAKENSRAFIGESIPHRQRHERARSSVKSLKGVEPDMNASFTSRKFVKWTLDHDAVAEAKRYVEGTHKSRL